MLVYSDEPVFDRSTTPPEYSVRGNSRGDEMRELFKSAKDAVGVDWKVWRMESDGFLCRRRFGNSYDAEL